MQAPGVDILLRAIFDPKLTGTIGGIFYYYSTIGPLLHVVISALFVSQDQLIVCTSRTSQYTSNQWERHCYNNGLKRIDDPDSSIIYFQ